MVISVETPAHQLIPHVVLHPSAQHRPQSLLCSSVCRLTHIAFALCHGQIPVTPHIVGTLLLRFTKKDLQHIPLHKVIPITVEDILPLSDGEPCIASSRQSLVHIVMQNPHLPLALGISVQYLLQHLHAAIGCGIIHEDELHTFPQGLAHQTLCTAAYEMLHPIDGDDDGNRNHYGFHINRSKVLPICFPSFCL